MATRSSPSGSPPTKTYCKPNMLGVSMDPRYRYYITDKMFDYYRIMHGWTQIFKHEDKAVCEKLLKILQEQNDE